MYLTYSEYQAMGGALAEPIFMQLELLAEGTINEHTAHRIVSDLSVLGDVNALPYAEQLKTLVCMIVNLDSTTTAQNETSVSNSGISVSYKANAERNQTVRSLMAILYGCEDRNGTPLLWRGLSS